MKPINSKKFWNQIRTGDRIEARITIDIPDEDGHPRRSVTVGKQYPVTVYAEHSGWMVCIIGDNGYKHEITGDYIENFKLIPRKPVEQENALKTCSRSSEQHCQKCQVDELQAGVTPGTCL